MATYNGHRSWNAWNVSLWISNDEGIYRAALECLARGRNLAHATRLFMRIYGGTTTPDGANYNTTCVREALADLRS